MENEILLRSLHWSDLLLFSTVTKAIYLGQNLTRARRYQLQSGETKTFQTLCIKKKKKLVRNAEEYCRTLLFIVEYQP